MKRTNVHYPLTFCSDFYVRWVWDHVIFLLFRIDFYFKQWINRKNDDNNKSKCVVEVVGFSTSFAILFTFCSTFESIVLQINLRHLNPSQLNSLFKWWAFGAVWLKIAPFISINCLLLGQLGSVCACMRNQYVRIHAKFTMEIYSERHIYSIRVRKIYDLFEHRQLHVHVGFYLRIPIHFHRIILHFWCGRGGIFRWQEGGLHRCHCTQFAFFVSIWWKYMKIEQGRNPLHISI